MAGAISGTTLAALLAMAASAAVQYKASTDASKRATEATQRALARQHELQLQAEAAAKEQAGKFDNSSRVEKQAEIERQLTQEYTKPVESAQTINQEAATTQGNVSNDYLAAKATSDAKVLDSSRKLAQLLAKTNSAGNLRMGEGFDLADTATNIGMLGNFSKGQEAADAIAIRNAAQPDAGMILGGQLLGALGSAGLAAGAGSAAAGTSSAMSSLPQGTTTAQQFTTGIGLPNATYQPINFSTGAGLKLW